MRKLWLGLTALLAFACTDSDEPAPAGDATGGDTAVSPDTTDMADTGGLAPLAIPEGCNPLAHEQDCMLPWPSDVFRVDDPAMPSGMRVEQAGIAMPQTTSGGHVNVRSFFAADGAATLPHIMALFPEAIDPAALHLLSGDVTGSVEDDSATLLIDAQTGERILHLSEVDPREMDPTRRGLFIRALEQLEYRTRYIVVIRRLTTPAGDPVAPPEGFRRIRDGLTAGDPVLDPLSSRYESEIFPVLEAHGIPRDDLQLAWDFTTGSRERATEDMLRVRSLAISALEATPPAVTISTVEDDVNDQIGRLVDGTLTVPMYTDVPEAGAALNRGGDGQVAQNGTVEVPFTVIIPRSITDDESPVPARVIQYGHGFFGHRDEIEGSFVRGFAQELDTVVMAVDWWGMDETDRSWVADTLWNDPDRVLFFSERVYQGMVNQLALTYAALGPLLEEESLQVGGQTVIDPSRIYWYGISQGHILGGTFLALSNKIDRGVLGVGGAGFSHMMMRSSNFQEFLYLFQKHTLVPLEQSKIVAMTQTVFDRWDPITYADFVLADPLPGGPAERQVLMQVGLGDPQVPNMTARIHARALDLPLIEPAARSVPLLDPLTPPAASGYVEFDFNLEGPIPGDLPDVPPDDNEVHEGVRRTDAGRQQVHSFLQPAGQVEHFCDGPCDPE